MPSEVFFGRGVIKQNASKLTGYRNVFIVTGKKSAKKSGALTAFLEVIGGANFQIYDNIQENPLLSVCHEAGKLAYDFEADVIVGIGGGSPIDAAKAIALFAANPEMLPDDLYKPPFENDPLPIIAIPTTAGTGSEANAYSVMTLDGKNIKKTYTNEKSYPKMSFVDPTFTESLPIEVTISTALDALAHCTESLLTKNSTTISEHFAAEGISVIFPRLAQIAGSDENISEEARDDLSLGALYGGIAINTTGTCFPHPMGYNLTLNHGLPHGKACAIFQRELIYIHEVYREKHPSDRKLANNLDLLFRSYGVPMSEALDVIDYLADYNEKFSDDLIRLYVERIKEVKSFASSFCEISEEDIFDIYKHVVGFANRTK